MAKLYQAAAETARPEQKDGNNEQKAEAKNDLERLCPSIRDMLSGKRLRREFEVGDIGNFENIAQDALGWLEGWLPEQDERGDEYEEIDD
eukprot:7784666-Alexandrium_andersonii.AAC.1